MPNNKFGDRDGDTAMRPLVTEVVLSAACCILISGCGLGGKGLRDTLVGKWSQSTDPALAKTGLTVRFLPSGEFQAQTVFKSDLLTTPVTLGGSWRVEGQTVVLVPSSVDQPSVSVKEIRWQVKSANRDKLEYVVEGTNEAVTLFRVE
jgi:hypothetical protein